MEVVVVVVGIYVMGGMQVGRVEFVGNGDGDYI